MSRDIVSVRSAESSTVHGRVFIAVEVEGEVEGEQLPSIDNPIPQTDSELFAFDPETQKALLQQKG